MAVLALAEHDGRTIRQASLSAVAAALQLGEEVHLLVAGHDARAAAEEGARIAGVAKVLLADDPIYAHPLAEALAPLLIGLAPNYSALVAAATTFGKNVAPRVAARLDTQQISEIVLILSPDTFVRPIYAGNALATVQSKDSFKVVTVRATAFEPARLTGEGSAIAPIASAPAEGDSRFVGEALSRSERPELTSARIIVSGGRGMQNAENFKLIEPIAEALGAAIGASRAAVDAGFASNDLQVGQTGKIVAPDLYIAVGISGAIQHLAGMSGSKIIVAINKDESAPIFDVADYGLVADLFQALPELAAALKGN